MPRCSFCHGSMDRGGMRWDDGTLCCNDCLARLPTCDRCGRPFADGYRQGRARFCPRCFAEADRCIVCESLITGQYLVYEGRGPVCATCERTVPRCVRCNVPTHHVVSATDGSRSERICRACYETAEQCHACGFPLTGDYFVLDAAPHQKYCAACYHDLEQCDFCGLPVSGTLYRYPDGRVSCAACYATAVEDEGTLRTVEQHARHFLTRRLGMPLRPPHDCPVFLVDARDIAARFGKQFVPSKGFDPRERGCFDYEWSATRQGGRVVSEQAALRIFVEVGLPRLEAYGVLVHELTHLWQFDHFPREGVPPPLVEGHACWTQWHALRDAGADALAEHMTRRSDPVYGDGLRMLLALERRRGFDGAQAAVVAAARAGRLPG